MEYKRKLHKRRKLRKRRHRHDRHMVRRKIRGRKRWVKASPKKSAITSHAAPTPPAQA
ncbi:MAG: hypothetical protein N3A66_10770 [Planctomycetota bacterium]|nr:hypothetical protein [Planctomycetota bacterium]